MKEIILASSSPRRRELLSIITRRFTVQTSDCDETIAEGTGPIEAVRELSLRKAAAVWAVLPQKETAAVIGSDTVVYIDGEILGKPHSREQAVAMISRLAGRSHTVCTGVTIITAEETRTFHETTEVHFYPCAGAPFAGNGRDCRPFGANRIVLLCHNCKTSPEKAACAALSGDVFYSY